MSNIVRLHFCPSCGSTMEKERGTHGQYRCPKCRTLINPNKKTRFGDYLG